MKHNEAAILSGDSYRPFDSTKPNSNFLIAMKEGWKYLTCTDKLKLSQEDYFGVAFKKGDNIAIVHRGTKFLDLSITSDLDDVVSIWMSLIPDQYKYALNFFSHIFREYNKDYSLFTIGHSLGAVHAQLTGIAGNVPSICFDGPGVLGIAEKLFSQEQILQHKSIMYTSAPNAINTAGKHLVIPIQLNTDTSKHGLTLGEYWTIYTLKQHSIDNFPNAFDSQTGLLKEVIQPTSWPEGLMEGYKAFVMNTLQNDQENGYWLPRNGLDREQFAQKFGIDSKRVKHQKPEDNGNEVKKGIQYEYGDSYYILPATTGYNAKNEHQKPSFIDNLLDFASQTSESVLPNSWIDPITSEATAKTGNTNGDASADVRDALNQADNILHSNAFQNPIYDAIHQANVIFNSYNQPSGLGKKVKELDAIFSKFNSPELPCCDLSKPLHSTDCRVCPTNDEL